MQTLSSLPYDSIDNPRVPAHRTRPSTIARPFPLRKPSVIVGYLRNPSVTSSLYRKSRHKGIGSASPNSVRDSVVLCTGHNTISCYGSAMILPGLAIAVANLCKMLSRIYAKPFWTAVHNLCIDPTAFGGWYCWSCIYSDVMVFCKSCKRCQQSKAMTLRPFGLLHGLPIPNKPWESITMDFVGPFPEVEGHNYLWVVLC